MKKTGNRKFILLRILLLPAVLLLCSCAGYSALTVNTEKLKKNSGTMFTAICSNSGEVDISSDYLVSKHYDLAYDGTLSVTDSLNLSGCYSAETEISDRDYAELYSILDQAEKTGAFAKYEVDACDGEQWMFAFRKPDEQEETRLYAGYIYGNEKMSRIAEILNAYRKDLTLVDENGNPRR